MRFKKLRKELKSCFRKPNKYKKKFKSKQIFKKNILTEETTEGEFNKRYYWVHYIFKYKFFIPILLISKYLLRKVLVKDINNDKHNTNLRIFNEAYNKSLCEWNKHLRYKPYTYTDKSTGLLKFIKEIALTIIVYDTVYREFLNILMFNIGQKMHDKYKDNKVGHIFYSTEDMYDVQYFKLFEKVQMNHEVYIKKLTKVDSRTTTMMKK